MFVITADQVDSSNTADLVDSAIRTITERWDSALVLPVDRTAGDEFQLMTQSADACLDIALALNRSARWSVGCGIGSIGLPLPRNTRAAHGPAFVAARVAVDAAKKRENRFALRGANEGALSAADLEAVIDLLLIARARRSREGWELFDQMSSGATQAAAAARLGISPQAASKRAHAAAIKPEIVARTAIARLLAHLNLATLGAENDAE